MDVLPHRSTALASARFANALFFVMTVFYCLLSYSPFASRDFIKQHLIVWLVEFSIWHSLWFWAALGVTALTIFILPSRTPGRALGWSYVAALSALGVLILVRPVLPEAENNGRGLVLAFGALVPLVWLALVDHATTAPSFAPRSSPAERCFWACLLAGLVMWIEQSALVPWRLDRAGEITLAGNAIAFGVAISAVAHAAFFAGLGLMLFAILRLTRGASQYWALVALSAIAVTLTTERIVFTAIAFTGTEGWTVSIAFGLTMALVWSGIARQRSTDVFGSRPTALQVWLSPIPGVSSRAISAVALVALAIVGLVALNFIAALDWDFLGQKLLVIVLWFLACAYAYGAVGDITPRALLRVLAVPAAAFAMFFLARAAEPRISAWSGDAAFVPDFVREGYVAVDPSLHLIDALFRVDSPGDDAFYARLKANTGIEHVEIAPVDVNFVKAIHAPPTPRPDIFLLLVDSMRRDYLSAYNPAVHFTPAIGRFAAESVVFNRAFTRYGGTAMSVPAIWAGGMLLHKQYVTPFGPMNTLEKLLDGEGYRRFMSNYEMAQLAPADTPGAVDLDPRRNPTDIRLCQTFDEIRARLATDAGDHRPIFAFTLAANIHISIVRSTPVPPDKTFPGFEPHVAWQMAQMDACFGEFIEFLKATGRYDNSIVVLSSDHGDSLGESLRWGHSHTMFPEIVRVPLLVHLPPRLREAFHADPAGIALSTDITPSLYELLGQPPADLGPLFGMPLFGPSDAPPPHHVGPLVAVSSYGPVYAVYRDNGSKLYIADAVNGRDYGYDLRGLTPVRVGIPPADRDADREEILARVVELARLYRFTPQ